MAEGALKKIRSISLTRLNKKEYASLMSSLIQWVEEYGIEKLGVPEATFEALKADLQSLRALPPEAKANENTAPLEELDTRRRALVSHILGVCRTARNLPNAEVKKAAADLYEEISGYANMGAQPGKDRTELIIGLLFYLNKEDNKAHVATLGLTESVTELASYNDQYAELRQTRTKSIVDEKLEPAESIRERMDIAYDIVTTYIFAQSLINPSTEVDAFIEYFNAEVEHTQILLNRRMSKKSAKKTDDDSKNEPTGGNSKPTGEEEKPGTEPSNPSEGEEKPGTEPTEPEEKPDGSEEKPTEPEEGSEEDKDEPFEGSDGGSPSVV